MPMDRASLKARLDALKTQSSVLTNPPTQKKKEPEDFSFEDLENAFNEKKATAEDFDFDEFLAPEKPVVEPLVEPSNVVQMPGQPGKIHNNPRLTLLKLVEQPLNTDYTFNVPRFRGESYLSAMRQCLSRTRQRLRDRGKKYTEFKLVVMKKDGKSRVKTHPTHDEITVRRMVGHTKDDSVFDELEALLGKD